MRKVILFLSVFVSVAFAERDASCVKDVQKGVIYLDSMRCVVDQNGNGMADDCGELPVCRRHGERFLCPVDEGDRLCMREDVVVRERTDRYVRFETKNPVSFEEWQAFLREHNLSCAESGDRGREWLCGDSGLSDGGLQPRKIGVGLHNNPLRCRDCIDRLDTTKGVVEEEPVYEERPTYSDNAACVKVRFFSGWRMSCRAGGLTVVGASCCGISGWFSGMCSNSERELKRRREAGTCKEIGKYCSKRVKVGPVKICVEESKSFCCFNSRLARILQECGRPQIGKTWGSAKSPDCSGFSMEEFQRLDFSNPECVRAIEEWMMGKAGSFGSVDWSGIAQKGVQAVERWLDDARNRKRD